jgi:hypothetical protein
MPHKVNPIDFENSEGNLGVATARRARGPPRRAGGGGGAPGPTSVLLRMSHSVQVLL